MTRFAIERLVHFIDKQVTALFGEHIAVEVRVVVGRRQQAIASALDALRRQYPDYLAELEVRFFCQSTFHHEMVRYQSLFEEGLISLEIYDDLKRNTQGARAAERPRFDIGLDTHQLVKRLDLLAGLDERQLESVCRLLRPRFAVPQERIIRKGERGDAVYFIVSGAVEVILAERRVRPRKRRVLRRAGLALGPAAAGRHCRPHLLPIFGIATRGLRGVHESQY